MISVMNDISMSWWDWMSAMFWQVSLLIVIVACIDMLIKKWSWPQLRYALWLLVVVKLIIPPGVSMNGSLVERIKPGFDWIISSNIKEPSTIVEYSPFTISDDPFIVTQQTPVRQSQAIFTLSKQLTDVVTSSAEKSEIPTVKLIWQSHAFVIWLLGMAVLGFWLFQRLRKLRMCQSRKDSACAMPQSFHMVMSKCAQRLKLSRIPRVVVTKKVVCPAVFGVFNPILLMPKGYLGKLSRKDAEHMLLHELAHIKRRDPVIHSFYLMLQIMYWFNPLLWLARRQIIHLRELCCDATVARILKHKTNAYRQTLIDIARQFLTRPLEPGLGLLGLFEDTNRLLVRLSWLEKKTWRYQKMKNLTVISIITLMLVFVLPMAKAQEHSSTEDHSVHSEHIDEALSENLAALEIEHKQLMDEEDFSQELKKLREALEKLEIEKQNLQKELAALEVSKVNAQNAEKDREKVLEFSEVLANIRAAKDKAEKDKAKNEYKETKTILKQMEQWQNSDQFKQWQEQMKQWELQMQQWQQQFEHSIQEHGIMDEVHELPMDADASESLSPLPMPHPVPVMPPIPEMPPMPLMPSMPEMPPMPFNADVPADADAPADIYIPSEHAPMVITPNIHHTGSITPKVSVPVIAPSQNVPVSKPTKIGDIKVTKTEDGKYVATREMNISSKVQAGNPLIIKNNVGNIALSQGKDNNCTVKAVISATAENEEEAREMVEKVAMMYNSSKELFHLETVKEDNDNWNNLNVNLFITVPRGVNPDIQTNVGNLKLTDIEGNIRGTISVGSIKATNLNGQIQLTANVGDIDFTINDSISAKLQAITKIGSVESDLPPEIEKGSITSNKTELTIGSGENNIHLKTEVGNIRIKKSS